MSEGDEWDGSTFEPCVQCGQWSYVRVILFSNRDIFFCGHHFSDNADKLESEGAFFWDMRHLLGVSK